MAFRLGLLGLGSLLTTAMALAVDNVVECGTAGPTKKHLSIASEVAHNETLGVGNNLIAKANIEVPLYVHIVASSESELAKERDVHDTIDGMNRHYATIGFHFRLKKIDYTVNDSWSHYKDESVMKGKLHKGDYRTLNLYYISNIGDDPRTRTNGACYLPTDIEDSETVTLDGCVVRIDQMTNGQTTTHEVGHWLGLYHTFEGGCEGEGDYVDDTPYCHESQSCDENRKSCPDKPGNDPVHNFMSYGKCRNQFTAGQGKFARTMYYHYRS